MNAAPDAYPNPQEQWWGIHATHGWVVFDRQWAGNQWSFPFSVPLVFVRCSGWELFADGYDNWKHSSDYRYALQHLKQVDVARRAEQERLWMGFVGNYLESREDLERRGNKLRRELALAAFCERTGRKPTEVKAFAGQRNSDPCWKCPNRFNGNTHFTCIRCGWLVCCDCNACGCGRPGRR